MTKKLKHRVGCLCCPRTQDLLPLGEVLYNGFGGYTVYRNNKLFYSGDPQGEWKYFKTLKYFEKLAQKDKPTTRWKVILNNPLRGATWVRKGKEKWLLTDTNLGFA